MSFASFPLDHRSKFTCWIDRQRWRASTIARRWTLAWRFATNRLGVEDGARLMHDCQHPAQDYMLVNLAVASVIEDAEARWGHFPALPRLAAEACARVASRYEQSDAIGPAIDWALDLIADYAKMEKIVLVEQDSLEFEDH